MRPKLGNLLGALVMAAFLPACPSGSTIAQPCVGLRYVEVAKIDGMKDRIRIQSVSRKLAYYTTYFDGGRVTDAGLRPITFDSPQVKVDPAILEVAPLPNGKAWFLLRKVWYFDGTRAQQVPTPDSFEPTDMAYGGGKLWISGRGGASVYRRDGNHWTAVPINDMRPTEPPQITVDEGGRPYALVSMEIPRTPREGVMTLELRLRRSIWMLDGSRWREITPARPGYFLAGGDKGVLWTVSQGIEVHRFSGGRWTTVPLETAETQQALPLSVAFDRVGRLWISGFASSVASEKLVQTPRLWVLEGAKIRRVPINEADFEYEVASVSPASDGTIWLAGGTRIFRGACFAGVTK